jgi:hypothetical protein
MDPDPQKVADPLADATNPAAHKEGDDAILDNGGIGRFFL